VNHSEFKFTVNNDAGHYGLGHSKGVGEGPASDVEARHAGPFAICTTSARAGLKRIE
jgi:hypothetical protein